jgi:hypothetical protein
MVIHFSKRTSTVTPMKLEILALILACFVIPCEGQIRRPERKSLLDSDPDVVYLDQTLKRPIELKVIKEAPVFGDKDGKQRLGTLKADQSVRLEAITEKCYRVCGQGTQNGISGWVAPWAFSSADPEFVANLKLLYERQIQVQKLVAAKQVAVGMTPDEVSLSKGSPTTTSLRKTAQGQSGKWEFIEYDDVKNYATEVDRNTGQVFRRLVSITRVEKGKITVEFENDAVTAIEETENHQGGDVRIIVPPLVFRW